MYLPLVSCLRCVHRAGITSWSKARVGSYEFVDRFIIGKFASDRVIA